MINMAEHSWSDVDLTPLSEDDLCDTIRELTDVAASWRNIGIFLGVRDSRLEAIQGNNPLDCLRQTLATWLRRNYNVKRFGEPTWEKLVEAVNHPAGGGNPSLAMEIARRHGVTDQPDGVELTQHRGRSAQSARGDRQRQSKEQEYDKQIRDLQQRLQVSDGRIQEIQEQKQELERATWEKDRVIEAREKQIQELNQQMTAKEQVATHFQQNLMTMIHKLQEDIRDLRHELREKDKVLQRLMAPQKEKLTLSWKRCRAAPCKMYRGSSTMCGSMVYFSSFASRQVHSYNSGAKEWSTLPECPAKYITLAVVSGLVTNVGGWQSGDYTNTLFSLMEDGGRRKWVEHFPRMPTKRALTAVVCSGKALVVAGGEGEGFTVLTTVEVMDTDTLNWSTASNLPHPLSAAVATVCRDGVYLVAGRHQRRTAESVLTCSLSDLQSHTSYQIWRPIADLPVEHSTLVTLNGQLLAVGGQDYRNKTNNIYSYNRETNSWEVISHMPTPRYQCLVAVLPHNELMVVGGWTTTGDTDKIEIASVEVSSKYVVSQHIICYSEL